ncbi:MAG: ketoacyl-ACP synthase III [Bernardetiaceae bacterium]|jgi:3-oxoacyl-[acyl-carrier-protein] synthase-3|nr:ketoacyl-ACP synthase III [Bernardetiaceae bacterium]
MAKITANITGVAGYVPDYVLTNRELETMVDTNDEWIVTRTGIRERRILKDPDKATAYMATQAVNELLAQTNTRPQEIDAIICATATPDMMFPATANLVGAEIGANNAFGYDLQAACSGFLYSLTTGAQMIESGRFKKVLVIGADKMSSIVDYTDRSTCIIFGDGAAAVLLEPNTEGFGFHDCVLRSDGSGGKFLNIYAGGSLHPASHETVDKRQHYIFQDGQPVFKMAVSKMAEAAQEVMQRNQLTANDIAWLVPHQANKRIIDATARAAGLPDEKVMITIAKYGNTTNATIPLCLRDYKDQLKKGDKLLLAAFGGGYTWGAAYLTWGI